jgi:hypothetical protein
MSIRCQSVVMDPTTKRNRKCKLSPKFFTCTGKYCILHCKIKYNYHVIKIQAAWIGFRTRIKLKNLYIGLPRDLQLHVLKFARESFYIERQHKIINKIIAKRFERLTLEKIVSYAYIYVKYKTVFDYTQLYKMYYRIHNFLTPDRHYNYNQANHLLSYYDF